MIPSQPCRSCGEAKAIDAYERLPNGGYRGTCIACRRAAAAARKRLRTQERHASPEHQAKLEQQRRAQADREARWEAERAAAAALATERAAQREAQRLAAIEQGRMEREERAAGLRDEIWSAMRRGRSHRALEAVRPRPSGRRDIKLKQEGGFISIAEMACRCAEREASFRAAKSCKTFEAASAAIRILEQPTPTFERTREVSRLWRSNSSPRSVSELLGPTAEADEVDPFEEAFGDWAPAWMQAEARRWAA
jgi:hypothetical protein